jgi:hypothetical protein
VKQILRAAILSLSMPFVVCSQVVVGKPEAKSADEKPAKANEEMLAAQRRSYAVSRTIHEITQNPRTKPVPLRVFS